MKRVYVAIVCAICNTESAFQLTLLCMMLYHSADFFPKTCKHGKTAIYKLL